MTGREFREWMASIEVEGRPIRGVELARRLGISQEHLSRIRRDGADNKANLYRLAMAAISNGVKPWGAA